MYLRAQAIREYISVENVVTEIDIMRTINILLINLQIIRHALL